MSSTPAPASVAAPSSRVQSASNKTKEDNNAVTATVEKTSRPPSAQKAAADTSKAPVTAATGASAAGNEEPSSPMLTPSERLPSANKSPVTATTTTEARIGSAAKNSSQGAANRPGSAAKVDPTITPALEATNTGSTAERPPSANRKADETAANNTTTTVTGSRPPSANRKQDETTTSNTATAPTTEKQDTLAAIDPNDPNITQPIIGQPSSAAKKEPSEVPNTVGTLVAAVPLSTLSTGVPVPADSKQVKAPAALPATSSSKKPQARTTTESTS